MLFYGICRSLSMWWAWGWRLWSCRTVIYVTQAIRLYCSNDTNVSTTKPPKQELRSKEGSQNIGWRGYVGTDSPIVGVWMRSEEFNGDGIHYTYKGDDLAATAVRFLDSKGRKYKAGEKISLILCINNIKFPQYCNSRLQVHRWL